MIRLIFILLQLIHLINARIIYPPPELNSNNRCISHNDVAGKCVPITHCPSIAYGIHRTRYQPKICSWKGLQPIICCPLYWLAVCPPDSVVQSTETEPPLLPTTPSTTEKVSTEGELIDQETNCGIKQIVFSISVQGGTPAEPFDWPWIAALFTKSEGPSDDYKHYCGGTIIAPNYILTAAHCVDSATKVKASELFVGVGSNNLTETIKIPIRKIIIHPDYSSVKRYNDIAILLTRTRIKFNESITPICLPETNNLNRNSGGESTENNNVAVAGWGRQSFGGISSPQLLQARLKIIPNQQCNQSYASLNNPALAEGIRKDQLCAGTRKGGIDSCQGDSGGPLTKQEIEKFQDVNYLTGIVSFGRGCGQAEYPGVYTRVTEFIPWIKETLGTQFRRKFTNSK